jgi:hypothetical protein
MGADAIDAAPNLEVGRSYEELNSAVYARVHDGRRRWYARRAVARLFAWKRVISRKHVVARKRVIARQRVIARKRILTRNRIIVRGRIARRSSQSAVTWLRRIRTAPGWRRTALRRGARGPSR